jgi:glycosyltransferase involved in cell wall biosynthesis
MEQGPGENSRAVRRDPADSSTFAPDAAIRRPKILFLISTLAGGIGTSLKAIVPFLTARYDIRVCEFLAGDPSLKKSITGLNIEIEEIDRPGTDIRIAKDILKTLKHFQPDLVQGFELETNFYACLLGKCSRGHKIVATFHGMVSAFRWTHAPFLQTIFLAADAVVCVSEALRQRCRRFALRKRASCSVIRNGVDIARFFPVPKRRRPDEPFILGYVANFYSSVKGHRYLLEAVAALPRHNIKLWLVGDGALLADTMRVARELDIDRQVLFLGPRDDVPMLLSQMDAFVLPSLTEGCPHALLEAMASGLPVIATEVGGVPEIVTDNQTGILVPPRSPDAIKEAILRLIDDDSLRDLLRRNARALVESAFTDRMAAAAFSHLYDQLMSQQP